MARLDLTHLQLDVRDFDRSERFYRDVLGLPAVRFDDAIVIRDPGFLIVLKHGEPAVGGTFHFGFRLATAGEVDAWFAAADPAVTVLKSPATKNGVHVGRIADPDGYGIEIYADV